MRKHFSLVIFSILLVFSFILSGCATSTNAKDYLDAEYVLESQMPSKPSSNGTTLVVTRLIFFEDGHCTFFYTFLRSSSSSVGDGDGSNSTEYSYSPRTHYISLNAQSHSDYNFVYTISEDLETITGDDGSVLQKVK